MFFGTNTNVVFQTLNVYFIVTSLFAYIESDVKSGQGGKAQMNMLGILLNTQMETQVFALPSRHVRNEQSRKTEAGQK